MRTVRLIGLTMLLLFSSHSLAADQKDLDTLFAKLRDPAIGSEVLRIEPQIWSLWMSGGSLAENEALAKATKSMDVADFDGALRQLDALLKTSPAFPEVWNKRATLYFLMGRFDESLSDIVKTLELEPRHFGALSGRGMIYERLGRDAEALAAYQEALAVHPQLLGARLAIKRLVQKLPEL